MAATDAVTGALPALPGPVVDLVPFAVDPPQLGGQVVIRSVNAGLAGLGCPVEQFSMGIRKADWRALGRRSQRQVVPGYWEYRRTDPLSVALFLVSVGLRIPYVWAHRALELRPWAALHDRLRHAAAVLVEMPWCYTPARIRPPAGAPLVYAAHNAEFQLAAEWRDRWGRWGSRLADYAERCEARLLRDADFTIAISREDAQALLGHYAVSPERVLVIPRGLDLSRYVPLSPEARAAQRRQLGLHNCTVVVFAGSHHLPNLSAAAAVLALSRQLGADYRCIIAGSVAKQMTLAPGDTAWLRPGDPSPYLQVADVAVNPMTLGSGMNIKMLQYLAWGLPVISTPWGARGLNGCDHAHYVLSAQDGFADQVRRLAADPTACRRLGEAGRQLVEAHFSAQATAHQFAAALHHWRSQHAAPAEEARQ